MNLVHRMRCLLFRLCGDLQNSVGARVRRQRLCFNDTRDNRRRRQQRRVPLCLLTRVASHPSIDASKQCVQCRGSINRLQCIERCLLLQIIIRCVCWLAQSMPKSRTSPHHTHTRTHSQASAMAGTTFAPGADTQLLVLYGSQTGIWSSASNNPTDPHHVPS